MEKRSIYFKRMKEAGVSQNKELAEFLAQVD